MSDDLYRKVLEANIEVHTRMASTYSSNEPHFRPENVAVVERRLREICTKAAARRLLDVGCGNGFIIHIAKKFVAEIVGVDATQAMLDRVDLSGDARIDLICGDTASVQLSPDSFDVVTGYSFFHHLYDIEPTLRNAFRALKPGGWIYGDLEPNQLFWELINTLPRDENYDQIIGREIEMVTFRNEGVEKAYDISKATFSYAEYGKDFLGGFREEKLVQTLQRVGFKSISVFYDWFLGQGNVINDASIPREVAFHKAEIISHWLRRVSPLSRGFFKYLGFHAQK